MPKRATTAPVSPITFASEHHDAVDPYIPEIGIIRPKPPPHRVDGGAVVRIGNTGRGRAAGVRDATGAGLPAVAREIRIAGLVGGDEMALLVGVSAATLKLDVFASLPRDPKRRGERH